MSHIKYKTPGIVIGGSNIGEASRIFNLFTKDFGLIQVKAQGIRELRSKLRYNAQNLFFVEAYILRGRNGWMLTEVYKKKNVTNFSNKNKTNVVIRVLLLLRRMVPAEERHEQLFDIISTGLEFLDSENLDNEEITGLETLIVLRFLRELGYVENKDFLEEFFHQNDYNRVIISKAISSKALIIKEINLSIQASQL